MKKLIHPAGTFKELFDVVNKDMLIPIHKNNVLGMYISSYCLCSDEYLSLKVKPKDELVKSIEDNVIAIDDRLYFEIINWGKKSLVVVKYSSIIGSRWIAHIKTNSVPKRKA